MILQHLLIAISMALLTVVAHAAFTVSLLSWLHSHSGHRWAGGGTSARIITLGGIVSVLTVLTFLEGSAWAGVYLWIGALDDFGEALYFSLVTFTTLGYGDVTLGPTWRVLSALQSANGLIIFGWTTALVVALLQRMLALEDSSSNGP